LLSTVATVITTIGMVAYFFVGTGKFLSIFLPFSPQVCSILMIAIALFYTAISGIYGVAYTDLFQSLLIGFATIFISVKAFLVVDLSVVQTMTSEGWVDIIPSWRMNMPSGYEIYNLFGLSVIFYFLKVFIEGFGGPQGYTAQRYFSVKSDRESGLLTLLWTSLLSFRWPFIIAVAILGLTLGTKVTDPEMVLPMVLVYLVPTGIKGLIIAALIAAAMSTFDSTINAGASYLVNDVYLKYIKPKATEKELIRTSYAASILIVVVGIGIGIITPSINTIWGWLTMSLGAGMFIPLFVRWYWWRLNGYGFACGTGIGILGAILQKALFPYWPEWTAFIVVSAVSLCGMLITTLLTEATPTDVLNNFYKKTRPFGFWKKIKTHTDRSVILSINKETRHDLIALVFAIPWQISLFLAPIHLVLHHWVRFYIFLSLLLFSSVGLYFFWYKNLNRNYLKE
jgi:solute:Na+ symporter, SSS family